MFFFIALLNALLPAKTTAPQKIPFTVEVQNIRQLTGSVHIGIFRSCNDFPGNCTPTDNQIISANQKNIRATFLVEPGDYAVAVYQDVNANGKMDKKMFGIPKEPYGFSNNFKPMFSGPTFADCRVRVSADGKQITIHLL
ncbi:DUF2141 domain-containing protein [Nibrella saemangeumensis]|uniref:DUF2141 domain-containing protein n=1 Tax=Nibrella saemangeumensis TaxID=1084526 RepID=A0ABP8MA81_9BACT